MQALQACVRRYGPATINLYSVTLWDAVKFEILNSEEEDLASEALIVLYETGLQLSTSTHEGPLPNFLKPVCKECNEHLEDAPTKQSSASGRILGAIAESSAEAASFIVKAVLPQLIRFCQSADGIPRRRGLLEVMNKLVEAHLAVFGRWRQQEGTTGDFRKSQPADLTSSPSLLADQSSDCLNILSEAVEGTPIHEVSFRTLALEGLRSLALVRGLLDVSSIVSIIRLLAAIIITEAPHGRDEVKAKSVDVMVDIARQKPQLVVENAFPQFMVELPDTDNNSMKAYVPILEAFAKLSAESQIFDTIILRLKNKLYTALRQKASAKYLTSILSAIFYAFSPGSSDDEPSVATVQYYPDLVVPLLKDVVSSGPETFPDNKAVLDEAIFELIGRVCNIIVRRQPFAAQTEMCRNTYVLFRTADAAALPPFHESNDTSSLSMITSTHILAALHPQLKPHDNTESLLHALVDYTRILSRRASVTNAAISQISLLVNKYIERKQVPELVSPYLTGSHILFVTNDMSPTKLRIAFSIAKGLVYRADPEVKVILPRLLEYLQIDAHGVLSARLFSELIAPDVLLTRENHCKIYGIFRQRFFSMAAPMLISSYQSAARSDTSPGENHAKSNYLIALSGLIRHVPYELLQTQLEDLTPPLLQSLTLEDIETKASAIATISNITHYDPKVLESHAASIITRLLEAGSPSRKSSPDILLAPKYPRLAVRAWENDINGSPKIRAAALACLGGFIGSMRDEVLVPYQRQTVQRLAGALDDPKRAVRAEAVRCRTAWSHLAGADDDDDDL